jgi:hypothetical protein
MPSRNRASRRSRRSLERPATAAAKLTFPAQGEYSFQVRCTNSNGVAQPDRTVFTVLPDAPNWNPAGFMRNVVESIRIVAI